MPQQQTTSFKVVVHTWADAHMQAAVGTPHRGQRLSDRRKQPRNDAMASPGPATLAPRLPGPRWLLPAGLGPLAAAWAAITGRLPQQASDGQAGSQQQAVQQGSWQ